MPPPGKGTCTRILELRRFQQKTKRRQKSEDKIDYKAGIRFYHKVGEKIERGSPILTLYTDKKDMIDNVLERISCAIKISSEPTAPAKLILECIDKDDLERS